MFNNLSREQFFEIYARAESAAYFEKIKTMLGVESKEVLGPVIEAFKKQELRVPVWEGMVPWPPVLMGFDALCTRR